jgi:hypothetical protein
MPINDLVPQMTRAGVQTIADFGFEPVAAQIFATENSCDDADPVSPAMNFGVNATTACTKA